MGGLFFSIGLGGTVFSRTPPCGTHHLWGSNTPHTLLRLGGKRFISMGLHFIKQNIPGIEILEMPTANQYRCALARGWDIVGISLYLDETQARWTWSPKPAARGSPKSGAATTAC